MRTKKISGDMFICYRRQKLNLEFERIIEPTMNKPVFPFSGVYKIISNQLLPIPPQIRVVPTCIQSYAFSVNLFLTLERCT